MKPLVAEYRKIFNEDMISNTLQVRDGHKKIKAHLSNLMPIHKAVLGMVSHYLPSPIEGQPRKIDCLAADFRSKTRIFLPTRDAIMKCN